MRSPQKRRSPRKAGHGHKLAGWGHRNTNLLEWLLSLLPAVLLAGALIWQGVAR